MIGEWWFVAVAAVVVLALLTIVVVGSRRGSTDADQAPVQDTRPVAAVVANPTKIEAGTRDRIAMICESLGWAPPVWLETTVEDPGTGQTKAAVERGVDVVLAAGGDGTVRAVAQALTGTGVAMGLIPAGTGNLFARSVGTPLDAAAACHAALSGHDRKIDVGFVQIDGQGEEHVFLVMAGTGFDAAVMASTPEALKSRVGPLAYVISGLRGMRGHRTRVTLTFDDGPPIRRRTRTVLVGNSGTLLGGLVLMPQAELDDGVLDVVNLSPKGVAGWLAVAMRVISRTRHGHSRVEHWTARSIVIAADEPQPFQIDGDPIGDTSELRMRVDHGALVIRVPDLPPAGTPEPG